MFTEYHNFLRQKVVMLQMRYMFQNATSVYLLQNSGMLKNEIYNHLKIKIIRFNAKTIGIKLKP